MSSIVSPLTISGAIDRTSRNVATLAAIVHASLMLGWFLDSRIKGAANAGHRMAKSGVISSIRASPPFSNSIGCD